MRGMAPGARALPLADLNRTLLARQLLLERRAMPLVRALEATGGLQAQDPVAPLFGLLSRLDGGAAGAPALGRPRPARGARDAHARDGPPPVRARLPGARAGRRADGPRAAPPLPA